MTHSWSLALLVLQTALSWQTIEQQETQGHHHHQLLNHHRHSCSRCRCHGRRHLHIYSSSLVVTSLSSLPDDNNYRLLAGWTMGTLSHPLTLLPPVWLWVADQVEHKEHFLMVFSANLNHRHENYDDHHDGNQEHLLHGVSLLASDAHQCSPLQIFSSSSTGFFLQSCGFGDLGAVPPSVQILQILSLSACIE